RLALPPCLFLFLFSSSVVHLDLHSFPTRRSSDLVYATFSSFVSGSRSSLPSLSTKPNLNAVVDVTELTIRFKTMNDKTDFIFSSDRKSTRLNSSHVKISYAVFCLKKKKSNTSCYL